jgi:hypothetical protein
LQHWSANLEMFASVAVLGLGLLLAGIAFASYARMRSPRALIVGLGFLVLSGQGVYLTAASWRLRGAEPWVLHLAAFDLALALLLYFAIRKA